jgi:hypothetical protein
VGRIDAVQGRTLAGLAACRRTRERAAYLATSELSYSAILALIDCKKRCLVIAQLTPLALMLIVVKSVSGVADGVGALDRAKPNISLKL